MKIEQIKKEISFIDSNDLIERVTGGYSLAETYKITKQNTNKTFFLKILDNRENAIPRLKEIYKAYQLCDIKTPELIDCGVLEQYQKYYAIYEWIDGVTLKQMQSNEDKTYFYEIGKKVAQKMKLLRNIKPKFIEKAISLDERIEKWFYLLDEVPEKIKYKYLSKDEVNKMKEKIIEYKDCFNNASKSLIHTDIKQGNIMLVGDEIYIIDIEDMEYDYEIFNMIRWPLNIFANNIQGEYDIFFQKGFMEEFEKDNQNLEKQLLFMYIVSFFVVAHGRYINNKLIEDLKLFRTAFDQTNGFTELNYKLFN